MGWLGHERALLAAMAAPWEGSIPAPLFPPRPWQNLGEEDKDPAEPVLALLPVLVVGGNLLQTPLHQVTMSGRKAWRRRALIPFRVRLFLIEDKRGTYGCSSVAVAGPRKRRPKERE